MPDIEAVAELSLRREELVARLAALVEYNRGRYIKTDEIDGQKKHTIDATLTKINEEMKFRNRRMDSVSWRNAVRAVLGEDAYNQCRDWIMINGH